MSKRLVQLDSLRGIAALSVVVCHLFEVFPALFALVEGRSHSHALLLLFLPPLYLLWAGHTAVLLFFVLSGFVLVLPFLEPRGGGGFPNYGYYIARRICRIYLPYVFCIAVTMLAASLVPANALVGLSDVMHKLWSQAPSRPLIAQHLLLVGTFDSMTYNGVIWTLVYELRISLIFPLIALAVMKWKGSRSIGVAIGVAVTAAAVVQLLKNSPVAAGYIFTLFYAAIFMVGATLAKYRVSLAERVATVRPTTRAFLVIAALLLCSADALSKLTPYTFLSHPFEFCAIGGICLSIILCIDSTLMLASPLVWLGKISYSLYLWHMPVLLTVLHLGYGRVSMWVLIPVAVIGSLIVASIMHRLIELPAMRLSRRIDQFSAKPAGVPILATLSDSATAQPA